MYTMTAEEKEMVDICKDMGLRGCYDYEKLANMFIDVCIHTFKPKRLVDHEIPQEVKNFWSYKKSQAWESASEETRESQLRSMWKKYSVFYEIKYQAEIHNKTIFDQIVYMLVDVKDPVRIESAMKKLREIGSVIKSMPNPMLFVDMTIINTKHAEPDINFSEPIEWQ